MSESFKKMPPTWLDEQSESYGAISVILDMLLEDEEVDPANLVNTLKANAYKILKGRRDANS